jgi:hypothetical protein
MEHPYNARMHNPWLALPNSAPYVLPEDAPFLPTGISVDDPGYLQLAVPPHPFAGCPELSRVVLLLLNPGFDGSDVTHYNDDPVYRGMVHGTFGFTNEPPMWCLDRRIAYTGAYKWLFKITRRLSEECGLEALQSKLMQVQYLAYKSRTYRHLSATLPSQHFGFSLVKDAIRDGKEIVVMRSRKLWLDAVPELESYPYIEVRNPRSPYLSERNLPEGGFARLCRALLD